MNPQLIEKLKKTGLTEKEALVYGFLITVSGAFPSAVAQKTRLNRSTVYKILLSLSIKGLISEIKKGKKLYYQVESPSKLRYFSKYKMEQAEASHAFTQTLIPYLEGMINTTSESPRVSFYEGKDRVIEAYMRHVQVAKGYKMTAFVSVADLKKFLPDDKFKKYIKEKERLGITARGITSSKNESFEFLPDMFTGIKKQIWPELRYISEELFPFPAEITMFDKNKISIIKFDDYNPIGVIIEDELVFNMMNTIFELVWNTLKDTNKKTLS